MKFDYEVVDSGDQLVKGSLTAQNMSAALRKLERDGWEVVVIRESEVAQRQSTHRRLKPDEIILALSEIVTLLRSGVAISAVVEAQASAPRHPKLMAMFSQTATLLQQGHSFSDALRSSGLKLPEYVYILIQVGEMTGRLAKSLQSGLEQMEYEQKIAAEIKNALIYPMVLVFTGLAAISLIVVFVIPKFANLLTDSNDLPTLAYYVLTLGVWSNENALILTATVIVALTLLTYFLKSPKNRTGFYNRLTRVPLVGSWLVEAETARWSSVMGAMLQNRVPLLEAMTLATGSMQLTDRREQMSGVEQAVRNGVPLSVALEERQLLTPAAYNLLRAGETAGDLAPMLGSIASLYDESGKNRMHRALLLIEPAAILTIGIMVGILILGLILAITSATNVPI